MLLRAVASIEKQTFRDFEVIVVDDHSTEDLSSVIPKNVIYLKTHGKGVSAARNTGLTAARGDFIAFLDSDDEWLPTKLEKQMDYLEKNSNCFVIHANEIWLRNGVNIKQSSQQQKMGGRIFAQLSERCLIAASSILVRKEVFSTVGLFDETFPVCEDFDLWLRIASYFEIGFIEEALSLKHAGHGDQLSTQFHSMDLWRVRALAKHLKNSQLSESETKALHSNLLNKSNILLKGFEKHKNFQHSEEVKSYVQMLFAEKDTALLS